MNGSTTIKLLRDRVLPRTRPAVDYELDYEYVPTDLVGQPEEKPQTKQGTVRIGLTSTVIAVWQLKSDDEILKVLYQHAKRDIERRAREGDIRSGPVIELESSTAPKECPYDPARVIREFDKAFKVEVMEAEKAPLNRVIFICHAEADKPIATALKHYFEKAERPVEVFQASHPASLPGGYEWWDGIRDALRRAPIVLTLYSERSKERPWLHFESGGAYFRGALVIPLAVPPEKKSIPPPLGMLQARDLASKGDVAAVVKEVGKELNVKFVGSSDELWATVRDAVAQLSQLAAASAEGAREGGSPWERQLRSLAAQGSTIHIHPIVPAAYAGDEFEIGPIDDLTVGLIKQDSRDRIDIPPNRVIGIRKAGDAYVLDLHGRVQWTDARETWLYQPEALEAKDPNGLAREIDIKAVEVQQLERKLKAAGWEVVFADERKARGQLSKSYQLVYGADGRYLRVLDRVIPLVMVKRRVGPKAVEGVR